MGRAHRVGTGVAVAVVMAIVCAPSTYAASSQGSGTLVGSAAFTNGTSIPPAFQGCENVTWAFTSDGNGSSAEQATWGAMVAADDSSFVGPMGIGATGASNGCEVAQGGAGSVTVNLVFGNNATGQGSFNCPSPGLSGTYQRDADVVLITVSGFCNINSSKSFMNFNAVATITPDQNLLNGVPGVTASITNVLVDGAWDDTTT